MNRVGTIACAVAVLALVIHNHGHTQGNWEDDPANPQAWTTGNVGIGLSVPLTRLHVEGGSSRFGSATNYGQFDANGNLRFFGTGKYLVPGNTYAFKAPGANSNIGLFFNSTNSRIEFRDNAGTRMFSTDVAGVNAGDGYFNQDLTVLGTVSAATFVGNGSGLTGLPAGSTLSDADSDTKIQVEESPDEDVIRFDVGGTERWTMTGARLEPQNTGFSLFIGWNAGANDDLTLNYNSFVGANAGYSNSTGTSNSFFGYSAGYSNTTGYNNSFFGREAGLFNTTGYQNSFFGNSAGKDNTTGNQNSFFGQAAGNSNTTGNLNSFFGYEAGKFNFDGSDNSFFGNGAGYSNTSGAANSLFGKDAGYSNTTGSDNSFFGYKAGYSNTAFGNSFFGSYAGNSNTTGDYNSFFGSFAGDENTTGYSNSFFGLGAGTDNTTGSRNSFFGKFSGWYNNTGYDNSFFGHEAGTFNTSGSTNCFFGSYAGWANDGDRNSFFGYEAGKFNFDGSDNSFFGNGAGYSNTSGAANSLFGKDAGYSNTTGSENSFFGEDAGFSNTTGNYNSFFGSDAGNDNTTGSYNTFLGLAAGYLNSTGSFNTAIGHGTFLGFAYNNSTAMGSNTACTASDQVRIGNSSVTSIGGYVNWTNISDSRFKKNVQQDVKGLEFIEALRPVSYILDLHAIDDFIAEHYGERETNPARSKYEKESVRYSGFIAQEVEAAAQTVGYDFSGVDAPKNNDDFYGLRYAEFVVPLVKAVQELQAMFEQLSGKPSIPTAPTKAGATPSLETVIAELGVLTERLNRVESTLSKLEKLAKVRSVAEPTEDADPVLLKNQPESINLLAVPEEYEMSVNFPNPFNSLTTVKYAVPAASHVTIEVYSVLGQRVRTLVDELKTAGYHTVQWDGKNEAGQMVSSGTYIYKMQSGDFVHTQKVVMAQ
jgi:hypothetical protein